MSHEGQKAVQNLLHKAEEQGQSRKLEASEVLAFSLVSGIKATSVALAAGALVTGGRLLIGENVSGWSILLTTGGVGVASLAMHLLGDMDTLIDGLRSFRSVETFTPPLPVPQSEQPHPPIVVRPYQGEPYTLGQPETPALPGREQLQLTPPVVAEILQAVVEQHAGKWSRQKLTALRINGHKVSRGVYEELTRWLAQAGVLLSRPEGGFTLPPDVQEFGDLRTYFPSLPPPGQAGRQAGRQAAGAISLPGQVDRGVGTPSTLAERHRQRWLECGCDVEVYRGKKKLGGATC